MSTATLEQQVAEFAGMIRGFIPEGTSLTMESLTAAVTAARESEARFFTKAATDAGDLGLMASHLADTHDELRTRAA
ncbi:MAG: hypothetical protein QM658_14275 [Gordonia sp. (in: high G+C Gram-positive bacteria)]